MVAIESAGITDVGKKRKGNEDAFYINNDQKIFVVADGMGGHQAGEVASGLVVKTIEDYMSRIRKNEDAEELAEVDLSLSKEANRLLSSIHLSNRVVYETASGRSGYKGMGSTVSAVFFSDSTMIATNVGDSPIYLIRSGEIQNLSVSHTLLAEQMALNPEASLQVGAQFGHVLTRAMGIDRTVEPYVCELQSFKDDIVVLASDGLTNKVTQEEILEMAPLHSPQKTCRLMVDLANDRGGEDNITLVVLRVKRILKKKSGIMKLISHLFR